MNQHEKGWNAGYSAAIHDAKVEGSRAFEELRGGRPVFLSADSVSVDTDEGALTLVIEADETYTVNIHGVDLDAFYDSVRSGIGGYLREREEALRTRPDAIVVAVREDGSYRTEPDEDAYDISNPKHPRYHSVHADLWDSREGK